jgi:uncharacterized protein YutE (UPF0331/DUF86 family)
VVADRLFLLERMLQQVRSLPLTARDQFFSDGRNVLAAESCLRRSLEILLDLGRHILAKGFARGVSEYKEIAAGLEQEGVLEQPDAAMLRTLAGYRNRMVHFYHEVADDELFVLCSERLGDLEQVAEAYRQWLQCNPGRLDGVL